MRGWKGILMVVLAIGLIGSLSGLARAMKSPAPLPPQSHVIYEHSFTRVVKVATQDSGRPVHKWCYVALEKQGGHSDAWEPRAIHCP
jgi:hypothetical protein